MLDQVLMNLGVNARDAMPNGGRLLIETTELNVDEQFARVHAGAAPGSYACMRVQDTGDGIPAEILPRIFEPFFTTKEPGKGTGLGLATVFGIVKQHQGWITADSEPGHGATFQVLLPIHAGVSSDRVPVAERAKPRGGTETVLLVEDAPEVRMVMREVLGSHGYKVLEAADGVEAVEIWREQGGAVALLLTDLVMPGGLSGLELAGRLRADQRGLKVILSSGYSAEIAGRELQLSEGEHFLQKPFTPRELLEAVRRSLDS